jgi:hypothetical protein
MAEPLTVPRDHLGMHDLNRTNRSVLLGFGLVLTPPAFDPTSAPEPTEHVLRIVDSDSEARPEQAEPGLAPAPEQAEAESIEFAVEPPAPALEPDATPPPSVRMIDGKRPAAGTGRIALGSMGLAASAGLLITAMTGPGWMGLDRAEAGIAGGLSIPLALGGVALVVAGNKSAKRLRDWSSRNELSPPETGNGLIVLGTFTTLGFAGTAAYATQWALTKPNPQRVDWVPTVAAGGATLVGMLLLTAGMLRRSKFSSWEQHAYAMPGAMALEHGGGVSVAGRF